MKILILKIEKCNDCPYRYVTVGHNAISKCEHDEAIKYNGLKTCSVEEYSDPIPIPNWCPLQNEYDEEGETCGRWYNKRTEKYFTECGETFGITGGLKFCTCGRPTEKNKLTNIPEDKLK